MKLEAMKHQGRRLDFYVYETFRHLPSKIKESGKIEELLEY